jgi:hypothetical protein
LAEAGYAAFVLHLYGESFPFTELEDRHMGLMSESGLIFKRAKAALETLGFPRAFLCQSRSQHPGPRYRNDADVVFLPKSLRGGRNFRRRAILLHEFR